MELSEKNKLIWVYSLIALFIVLNGLFMSKEIFWLPVIPVVLYILLLAVFSLDKVLMLIVFCTPLAINLQDLDFGLGISLPTEPLMAGILVIFIVKLFHGRGFDKKIIKHPVTIAIFFNLIWIAITTITSSLPVVSIKFLIARFWFVICFYFLATQLFRNIENVKRFTWLYIIPLTIVIFYTLITHAQYGFEEEPAHWVMSPFYNDHTAYGAILAMFFPILIVFIGSKISTFPVRFSAGILFVIFIVAIVLSYTRAAWLSLVAAFMVYLVFLFRIKLRTIVTGILGLLIAIFLIGDQVMMRLEKNRQDSSDDITEHVQSISNISSDASNLERINRWNSALRMFAEKPFFGWGPGTYMFRYAPFQRSADKTIISTNSGDKGNAHSEYIGPLAESGVFGAISFLIIIICTTYTASKLYQNHPDPKIRALTMGIFLGLVTYFIHGALNNFLDTDKAAVPFWGFIAMLVAMDVYHTPEKEKELIDTNETGA